MRRAVVVMETDVDSWDPARVSPTRALVEGMVEYLGLDGS